MAEQFAQQQVIQAVSGFVAGEGSDQAVPKQIKIANSVKNLVLHEFIGVAQTVLIQNAVAVDHDGIIHAATERQPALPKCLDVPHEPEGSRTTDFLDEGSRGKIDTGRLNVFAEGGVIEIDGEAHLEPFIGLEAGPFVAILNTDRFFDANEALRSILLFHARRLNLCMKGLLTYSLARAEPANELE